MDLKSPLAGRSDHYNGFIVDSRRLPDDAAQFSRDLPESLRIWKTAKRRGIWLKIPISKSDFIPIAVQHGFCFHHAQADYAMLTSWLDPTTKSTLPNYATHYVGVGGFVVNGNDEVLVVQEKNGRITGIWKLPGGMVEPGEDICTAAVREVFEETGIKCEFKELLCFREGKSISFGMTDLYCVCLLNPLNTNITIQESEIKDAKWMPTKEFFSLPFYKGIWKKMLEIESEASKGRYHGLMGESLSNGFGPGNSLLYHSNSNSTNAKL